MQVLRDSIVMLRMILSTILILLAVSVASGQAPQSVRNILKRGMAHLDAGELDAALKSLEEASSIYNKLDVFEGLRTERAVERVRAAIAKKQ